MLTKSIKRSETFMLKDVDLLIKQNISFAFYRLPNQQEPTLIIGDKQNITTLHSISELNNLRGFVIAPFNITTDKPIICIEPEYIISGYENIAGFFNDISSENSKLKVIQEDEHYNEYKESFDVFLKALKSKEFDKLVLSRPSDFLLESPISYSVLLQKALDAYPSSFVYLCHTPQAGTWMGATPELLLKGGSGVWGTVALAGTQKKHEGTNDYNWDRKNTAEQLFVSKYIKEILDNNSIQYTEQMPMTVESGDLVHLKTNFSFELNDSDQIISLIDKLHPTPAICGLPKEKAYRFILENESTDRAYYSGFIGYLDIEKDTNLYVNLRCMKIEPNHLRLYAGGGLLESSDFESEWNETEAKLQTMLSLLN